MLPSKITICCTKTKPSYSYVHGNMNGSWKGKMKKLKLAASLKG